MSRACGYPWDQLYGSTKLHALAGILRLPLEVAREMIVNHEHPAHREACELCFRSLYDYYQNHVSVFSTVLKDELRPTEKDARFFMPAPLEHVVVGLWLFGNSNDRFVETSNNFETPVTVGLDIPGPGASEFWRKVYKHEDVVDYDGASWDANVSMTSLMAIRDERIAGNPAIADEIREYYSRTYCRQARLCTGDMVIMYGMPSGQTLTSIDNSLIHVSLLGPPVGFDYGCNGDDLIVMNDDKKHGPIALCDLYASFGMWLEVDTCDTKDFFDLVYLGMTPLCVRPSGVVEYIVRPSRIHSSFSFNVIGRRPIDLLAKYVSLATLMYGTSAFDRIVTNINDWVLQMSCYGLIRLDSPLVERLLVQLRPSFQERVHGYASVEFPRV